MKSAAHAWPGPFAMFRFDSIRFVPLLAKSLAQSMAYLCLSFGHAISCGIVDSNRCAAPESIT